MNLLSVKSGGQMSEISFTGLNLSCKQDCILSRGSREELVALLFPDSYCYLYSLACGHFPHLQNVLFQSLPPSSHHFLL